MAVSDSTSTTYPATEYFLRGVVLDVVLTSGGGAKPVTLTAIVDTANTTFLEKGSTRKTSSVTCTFLERVKVALTDTVTLPGGQPLKVLRVTLEPDRAAWMEFLKEPDAYQTYWPPCGFTTTVLLA